MLRSMTGYGRGEGSVGAGAAVVEIRSVNNRQLDTKVHIPRSLLSLEAHFLEAVRGRVFRGRVEMFLSQTKPIGRPSVSLDEDLLGLYIQRTEEVAAKLRHAGPVDPTRMLTLQGVLVVQEPSLDETALWAELAPVIDQALAALVAAKQKEGGRLEQDFRQRLDALRACLAPVERLRLEVVETYRERIRTRLEEFLGGTAIDEARLAHELVLYADRCDITEETVRLHSHLDAFTAVLDRHDGGGYAPVGKEIDFLLQEMFREVNTIGTKANHLGVTEQVVVMKGEIEKMREQAQNVE